MTEQRIFRGRHTSNFSALSNKIWEDEKLSVEAKGTLGYLLSRPPNWHVRIAQVGRKLRIGRDKLYRIIDELIGAGYLERRQGRKGGAFRPVSYYVRDASVANLSRPEKPYPAQPYAAQPDTANQDALVKNEDSTKKESYKISSSTKPLPQTPCPIAPSERAAKRLGDERAGARSEHASIVQARVASRLGQGDMAEGWLLFGALSDSKRDELTAQERNGRLSDVALAQVRLNLRTG
jgi:DNA-binding MarR family transcriptional regulator